MNHGLMVLGGLTETCKSESDAILCCQKSKPDPTDKGPAAGQVFQSSTPFLSA